MAEGLSIKTRERDAVEIGYLFLKIAGMIKIKTVPFICYNAINWIWFTLGFISTFGQVIKIAVIGGDILVLQEDLHWSFLQLSVFPTSVIIYSETQKLQTLIDIVRNGFYSYRGGISVEQTRIRNEDNRYMITLIKVFVWSILVCVTCSMLRDPILGGSVEEPGSEVTRHLFYSTWFPFRINTWTRYAFASVFHTGIGILMAFNCWGLTASFVSLSGRLICEFKILQLAFQEAYDRAKNDTALTLEKNYQQCLYKRLRECAQHHQLLITYFSQLQGCFSGVFFIFFLNSAVLICLVLFLMTGPNSNFNTAGLFAPVVMAEVLWFYIFCNHGQAICDEADRLRDIVYNTPWYEQSRPVRYIILMVMIRTKRPLLLSGLGIKRLTMTSFSEILQSSYSYFNMLRAART